MLDRTIQVDGEQVSVKLPDWYVWGEEDQKLLEDIVVSSKMGAEFGEGMGNAFAIKTDKDWLEALNAR